jgi:hypothetical protein
MKMISSAPLRWNRAKCWALVDDRNEGLAMRKHKSWHEEDAAGGIQPSYSAR